MLNLGVTRYCSHCGRYPVAVHYGHIGRICERCLLNAIIELMDEQEPFRCPGCETVQEITDEPPFVCPKCGWNEWEWDAKE